MNIRNKIILSEYAKFPELHVLPEIKGLISNLKAKIRTINLNLLKHSMIFQHFFPKELIHSVNGYPLRYVTFHLENKIEINLSILNNPPYTYVTDDAVKGEYIIRFQIGSKLLYNKIILTKKILLNKNPNNSSWLIEAESVYDTLMNKKPEVTSVTFPSSYKLNHCAVSKHIKDILK